MCLWCTIRLLLKIVSKSASQKQSRKIKKQWSLPGCIYPVTKGNQNGIPLLPSHRTGSVERHHLTEIQRGRAEAEGGGKGAQESGSSWTGVDTEVLWCWSEGRRRSKKLRSDERLRGEGRKWGGKGAENRYWSGKDLYTGQGTWKWLIQNGKQGIRSGLWAEPEFSWHPKVVWMWRQLKRRDKSKGCKSVNSYYSIMAFEIGLKILRRGNGTRKRQKSEDEKWGTKGSFQNFEGPQWNQVGCFCEL